MKKYISSSYHYSIFFLLVFGLCFSPHVQAKMSIVDTKHNLSISGPGDIKALTETRVCVFCHTPHNASPNTPLWNKTLDPISYVLYESSTSQAALQQPFGPTRLCLSCHDGTIALGDVISVSGGIDTSITHLTAARNSYIGTDISNDHPVAFDYQTAHPNAELASTVPMEFIPYGPTGNDIHCSTCHDAHDDTFGKFLVMDNTYSALCTKCHLKNGWAQSIHKRSGRTWNGQGINPWLHTDWTTVSENGCENCHQPHSAGGAKRLLNYQAEEDNCFPCHNGNAGGNVLTAFNKISNHPVSATTIGITLNAHDPAEDVTLITSRHVECVDCHNPHSADIDASATAPNIAASMTFVKGVTSTGSAADPASYEYEVCFKCHGDTTTSLPYINRWINQTNTRLEFDSFNPSYHPVTAIGKNTDMPSLPSAFEPTLSTTSMMYCTDCHDSDTSPAIGGTGSQGPHGSNYAPILRQRYETTDFTIETTTAYALCYRCHDRDNLLNENQGVGSFPDHRKHVVEKNTPCSVCHDPHGVVDDLISGSHTHLINFDLTIVSPIGMQTTPQFIDTGNRSGYCLLMCHGKGHGPGMNYP